MSVEKEDILNRLTAPPPSAADGLELGFSRI